MEKENPNPRDIRNEQVPCKPRALSDTVDYPYLQSF
jgi:hypothetical protein